MKTKKLDLEVILMDLALIKLEKEKISLYDRSEEKFEYTAFLNREFLNSFVDNAVRIGHKVIQLQHKNFNIFNIMAPGAGPYFVDCEIEIIDYNLSYLTVDMRGYAGIIYFKDTPCGIDNLQILMDNY